MSTFDCLTVNDLAPFTFIGGTEQVLEFDIYDNAGQVLDLSSATCSWIMSPYGNPNFATLSLTGVISASPVNRFTVTISGSTTQLLSGKFTHQPKIIDLDGAEYRPSQGLISVIPRNATV